MIQRYAEHKITRTAGNSRYESINMDPEDNGPWVKWEDVMTTLLICLSRSSDAQHHLDKIEKEIRGYNLK
jgi:hypothetical protein